MANPTLEVRVIHPPPEILYHYTSIQTLYSMIETSELWLTHCKYMNDPLELGLFITTLKDHLRDPIYNSQFVQDIEKVLDSLTSGDLSLFGMDYDPFIFSLSENRDHLEMWNRYTQNSEGVCIAFSSRELETCLISESENSGFINLIQKCDYSNSPESTLNTKTPWKIAELNLLTHQSIWKSNSEGSSTLLKKLILSAGSTFKHTAYQAEKEWRVICNGQKRELHFRPEKTTLIPHIKLQLNTLEGCIKNIIIGPNNRSNLAINSIQKYLQKKGLNIQVTNSTVPYRVEL